MVMAPCEASHGGSVGVTLVAMLTKERAVIWHQARGGCYGTFANPQLHESFIG
jgi:hypothetical protein